MRVVTFDSCKTQSALSIKVWIVLNITESNLNKHGIMRIFFSKEIKDANRTACYHPRRVGIGVRFSCGGSDLWVLLTFLGRVNVIAAIFVLFILELTLPTGIFILEFHQRIILESNVN